MDEVLDGWGRGGCGYGRVAGGKKRIVTEVAGNGEDCGCALMTPLDCVTSFDVFPVDLHCLPLQIC